MRRIAVVAVAALTLLSGCSSTPEATNYLDPDQAQRVVRDLADDGGSRHITRVELAHYEAGVQVVAGEQLETWLKREGFTDSIRSGVQDATEAATPISLGKLEVRPALQALAASDIPSGCSERGQRVDIDIRFEKQLTHLYCLDNSRHVWLNPDLAPYDPYLDLRSPGGIAAALGDLRRITETDEVTNIALLYEADSRVDFEMPGACGNLTKCDALQASRAVKFDTEAPVSVHQIPPRLNYAEPFDPAVIDPAKLHDTLKRTLERQREDWWGSFIVTIYQVGDQPIIEYKVDGNVFYTDLDGRPVTP